jgi:hypothetical protein
MPNNGFRLDCPLCGSDLGSHRVPLEIPACCYSTLVNEIVRIRRAILQHRKETFSDDGIIINEADNDLYETIGVGVSAFTSLDEDDWFYDSEGNRLEMRGGADEQ